MEKKVIFKSEKFDLCGLLSKVNNDDLIVVLCHGYLSNKSETKLFDMLVERLQNENLNSFRFDFRGHGESSGEDIDISISNEIIDLENALDMLKTKGFNRFVLIGSSFGGCIISLINHKKYKILNMNIWYGALDFNEIKKGDFTEENMLIAKEKGYFIKHSKHNNNERKICYEMFEDFNTYNPIKNLKELNIPILLIHGGSDELVNVNSSINAHKECKYSKLIIIQDGTHLFIESIDNRNQVIDETINHIKNNI